MFKLVLLCACLTAVIANPLTPREEIAVIPSADTAKYLLPETTAPKNYKVKLTPNLTPNIFTFEGEVTILIKVTAANTETIKLHARDIEIADNADNVIVREVGGLDNLKKDYTLAAATDDTDFLVINLTSALDITKEYEIYIKFTGKLNNQNKGFYRSSYTDSTGATSWLATTQFESTDARRAFPCYDEPGLKATFDIVIVHDEKFTAIANTYGTSSPAVEGKITTTFATTPIMSTYLVAFVVSDFDFVEDETASPPQRVFSQPEHIKNGEAAYALKTGVATLKSLETFLGSKFQINKMDQIAIPDFSAGAMENWGLVTYRVARLMVTDSTSTSDLKAIGSVIAHEYAHQWFGNNVGPAYWKYIWLNEGFATYFGHYTTAEVHPSWKMDEQYLPDTVQSSLRYDSTSATRPMTTDAASPSEISSLFDSIAYDKSGSVIRMMEHILGTAAFKAGLTKYQATWAFKGATDDNLYEALEPAADTPNNLPTGVTFKTVMKSWSDKAGHPVVKVERDYANNKLTVSQKREFQFEHTGTDNKFWVPLNYVRPGGSFAATAPTHWLPETGNLEIPAIEKEEDFIIFNVQQTGYYRVNYDDDNWRLIAKYLKGSDTQLKNVHILNRAQLVDDSLNLAKSGQVGYDVAFELVAFLENEVEYLPWKSADTALTEVDRLFKSSPEYLRFKNYVGDMAIKLYTSLTTTQKDGEHVERFARNIAIKWTCLADVDNCREKTEELLTKYLEDGTGISVDLKSTVFCAALRGGNKDLWDKLQAKYAVDVDDRAIIVTALGCADDIEIKKELLSDVLATTPKLPEHKSSVLSSVYTSGAAGVEATLEYLHDNLEKLLESETNKRSFLSTLFSGLANRITTAEESENFDGLCEHYATQIAAADTAGTIVPAAKKTIQSNISWLKGREENMNTWLYDNVRGAASVTAINSALLAASVFLVYYFRN